MPGPAAKFPENRARRNKPAAGEWQTLPPLVGVILPDLPELEGGTWTSRTQRMWAGWRQDPVTAVYGPSEIAMAVELAFLYEKACRDVMSPSRWSEVRQWMDRLGLTLKGKRDLRLRIDAAAPLASVSPMRKRKRRGVLTEET